MTENIKMKGFFTCSVLAATLFFAVASPSRSEDLAEQDLAEQYKLTAERIRNNYDSNYVRLATYAQNHYAVRMYRLTGETYYAQQSGAEVYQITDRLNMYADNLSNSKWREQQAQKMIDRLSNTRRGKLRKKTLQGTGDKRFALYLIYQMAKLNEYGLKHPAHEQFVNYLKHADLHDFMMSADFIHAYAAQVANYVYWLKYIGVVDWTGDLRAAFENAYPDDKDDQLSKNQFNNKLYGLTHIVLADSNYYQQMVSKEKHAWILDYFEKRQQRIEKKSKEDIQAEIGLCYLLAGLNDHPTLAAMQREINDAVDPEKNMVLSISGSDSLSYGEHRNVLAYALLNWPKKLYQGPFLLEDKKMKASLPLVYQQ
ncbi:DUF3541 domain-containing protein [Thalassotalea sp. Y01]|uniref:DUF3541 domain-containing protein n=1 Tax=Thalassotalea sp. Y01 TaxID=2729613 RepID=UPI00180DA56A|nr:DUF3541 domain-containing protein [Thalassotalea sp. Y01]NMP17212.1 DUF3541 domain-containing protein [Thalassotalea sp. Y01]